MEKRLKTEWGGKIIFSNGTMQASGVMILIKKCAEFSIHNTVKDNAGRFVAIYASYGESRITFANIYAPNLDQPEFFANSFKKVEEMGNDLVIIAGDLNMVLDQEKDHKQKGHILINDQLNMSICTCRRQG